MNGAEQAGHPLIAAGAHRQNRQGQRFGQTPMVDPHAIATRFIGHVEGQHRRQTRFPQLQHQAQLAGYLGGVHHEHQQIRRRVAQEPLHDRLVFTAAGEVVHAR